MKKVSSIIPHLILTFLFFPQLLFANALKIYDESLVDFPHELITPQISPTIKQTIDSHQLEELKEQMINDYKRSRSLLEESVADVVMKHPDVDRFVTEYLERFYLVVKAYAEIQYEQKFAQKIMGPVSIYQNFYTTIIENGIVSKHIGCLEYKEKCTLGAGYAGSNPVAIRKIAKEGNLREKMFQYYRGGRFLEIILENDNLIQKLNEKLKVFQEEGKSQDHHKKIWQIRIDHRPADGETYKLGAFCSFKARNELSFEEALQWRNDHLKIRLSESDSILRIPLSSREKNFMQTITGDHDPYIQWIPGRAWFRSFGTSDCQNCGKTYQYAKAVEEGHLEQLSSVSSSADRMLHSAIYLDFTTPEELYTARLSMISMVDSMDHNLHEILVATKSFHLPFSFKVDFYKEIYPLDPHFIMKIESAQEKRGMKLPEYYLSEKYSEIKSHLIFKTMLN